MLDADVLEVAVAGMVGDVDVVRHGCHSGRGGCCTDHVDLDIHEAIGGDEVEVLGVGERCGRCGSC